MASMAHNTRSLQNERMNWPLPLVGEGEVVQGHMGRMAMWSGIKAKELRAILLKAGGPFDRFSCDTENALWALGRVCKLADDAYLRQHTMLPFVQALEDMSIDEQVTSDQAPHWSYEAWEQLPQPKPALCPECVSNQLRRYQYSVWRRVHQLPGYARCLDHGVPIQIASNCKAFQLSPDTVLKRGLCAPHPNVREWSRYPAVETFNRVATSLLVSGRRWPLEAMNALTSNRCSDLGIAGFTLVRNRPSEWTKAHYPEVYAEEVEKIGLGYMPGKCLVQIATSSFPASFLRELFPSQNNPRNRRLLSISHINSYETSQSRFSGVVAAIRLTLLYPTLEAMAEVLSASDQVYSLARKARALARAKSVRRRVSG